MIEPPGTGDPRLSTAISPAYLESLKSFEQLASSDSLFLQAAQQFDLMAREGASSLERLKRRILTVEKVKDTRLMRISVTLRDGRLAQAVAQYLAEGTAMLNRSLADEGDRELASDLARQTAAAKARLEGAQEAAAALTVRQSQLEQETLALRELRAQTVKQALDAGAEAAEYSAEEAALRGNPDGNTADLAYALERAAGARARQAALRANQQEVVAQLAEKEAEWAASRSKFEQAKSDVASAEGAVGEIQRRANDLAPGAGLRSEQIRIVDRGIVPQRPSFPNIPLILASALVLSLMAALVFVALQHRMSEAVRRPVREFRVARGAR